MLEIVSGRVCVCVCACVRAFVCVCVYVCTDPGPASQLERYSGQLLTDIAHKLDSLVGILKSHCPRTFLINIHYRADFSEFLPGVLAWGPLICL